MLKFPCARPEAIYPCINSYLLLLSSPFDNSSVRRVGVCGRLKFHSCFLHTLYLCESLRWNVLSIFIQSMERLSVFLFPYLPIIWFWIWCCFCIYSVVETLEVYKVILVNRVAWGAFKDSIERRFYLLKTWTIAFLLMKMMRRYYRSFRSVPIFGCFTRFVTRFVGEKKRCSRPFSWHRRQEHWTMQKRRLDNILWSVRSPIITVLLQCYLALLRKISK